jgi:hypothetical protein
MYLTVQTNQAMDLQTTLLQQGMNPYEARSLAIQELLPPAEDEEEVYEGEGLEPRSEHSPDSATDDT